MIKVNARKHWLKRESKWLHSGNHLQATICHNRAMSYDTNEMIFILK